jgi:enoyl-[acyl-carrier protein] reductase II
MRTRITELLGIKHPIILAGMSWISEPKLVAAVSNAGGLGILAIAPLSPEEARRQIRETRSFTDNPFAINAMLINRNAKEIVRVALEERVPVINYSLGRPWFIDEVHAYGGKVIGSIAMVKHAIKAEELGCDALVVTGFEAAAHGADPTSMVLIPLVDESVKIPLIAAGGFFDGRGLAAALVLGAEAISMGTRFIVTKESVVHDKTKQKIIESSELDTIYSNVYDGLPGRVLCSPGSEAILKTGPMEKAERYRRIEQSVYHGDNEHGFIYTGQSQGGIKDIPPVAELIDNIVAEAEKILGNAPRRYRI